MKWTAEQQAAIDFDGGSAIVSAAAGSGKTAILVARILRLLQDGENPVPADKLVVVTFTNKAAGELRQRLNRAVSAEIKAQPQNDLLKLQLVRLQNAHISTISSFCLDILRQNVNLLELSPSFTLLDETQADTLKSEIMEAVMEEFYSGFPDDEIKAITDFFVVRDDSSLVSLILDLHSFLGNIPFPDKWLDENIGIYSDSDAVYEKYIKIVLKYAGETLSSALGAARANVDAAAEYKSDKLTDVLQADYLLVKALFEACKKGDSKHFTALCAGGFARYPSLKNVDTTEIKSRRERVKKAVSAVSELMFTREESDGDSEKLNIILNIVLKLVKRFAQGFKAAKLEKNAVDFTDIEQLTLALLTDGSKPTELAKTLSQEFSCIIVDEFQDSNDVQFEIFRLISQNGNNLFFVGDIKQSIYGFRGANPTIFAEVCKDKSYAYLPLNRNFRSRESVVDTVNAVFDGLMTEDCGGVDYNAENALVCGASFAQSAETETEFCFVKYDDETEPIVLEAQYTAERIRKMLESGFPVMDKNGLRPCRAGDFCILLRSASAKAKPFQEALKSLGIQAISSSIRDYLALHEVNLILDFLTVIDNPLKSKELLSVMMSPLFMFTADELAAIKTGLIGIPTELVGQAKKPEKQGLFSCVLAAAKPIEGLREAGDKKCLELVRTLTELRAFMANNTIEQLINRIYDGTSFLSVISLYEYSGQKVANLRKLLSIAKSFESSGGFTLGDFLRYIKRMKDDGQSIEQANSAAESENAVQIMTVHGSKGLEFPFVFLCDLAKSFNKMDINATDYIFDINGGIALKMADRSRMLKFFTLPFRALQQVKNAQLKSEEMRLLYVALTRAKEKLFLISCPKKGLEPLAKAVSVSSEATLLSEGESWLEWLCASLAPRILADDLPKLEQGNPVGVWGLPIVLLFESLEEATADDEEETLSPADMAAVERIRAAIDYKYPHLAETFIPQKFTATDLAKDNRDERFTEEIGIYLRKPDFIGEKTVTGKKRGDAYHKAMQLLPIYAGIAANVGAELDKLAQNGLIAQAEREIIREADIAAFFGSEIGRRLVSAERIEREFPVFAELSFEEIGVDFDFPATDEKPIVQGIADLFFVENGRIILVDYKTDRVSDIADLAALYGKQLFIYKLALEKMLGLEVGECVIYSFSKSDFIILN